MCKAGPCRAATAPSIPCCRSNHLAAAAAQAAAAVAAAAAAAWAAVVAAAVGRCSWRSLEAPSRPRCCCCCCSPPSFCRLFVDLQSRVDISSVTV